MSVPGRSQLVPLPSQSPFIACHVLQELFWFEPFGIYFGDVFLRERCCDCRWFLSAPDDDLDAWLHHSADDKL